MVETNFRPENESAYSSKWSTHETTVACAGAVHAGLTGSAGASGGRARRESGSSRPEGSTRRGRCSRRPCARIRGMPGRRVTWPGPSGRRGTPTARPSGWPGPSLSRTANAQYHLWLGRAYGSPGGAGERPEAARARPQGQEGIRRGVSALDPDNLEARFGLIEFYLQGSGLPGRQFEEGRGAGARDPPARRSRGIPGLRPHRGARERVRSGAGAVRRGGARIPREDRALLLDRAPSSSAGATTRRPSRSTRSSSKGIPAKRRRSIRSAAPRLSRAQRLERGKECLTLYLQHEPRPDEPSLASAHYRLGPPLREDRKPRPCPPRILRRPGLSSPLCPTSARP